MTIRPATPEDVDTVSELEEQLFGADAWSAASVAEELTGPRRHAVVADAPGVVGYAVASRNDDVVDLQRIGVAPAHRRHGVATLLLDEVRSTAEASRMLLEVSAANTGALAFYAREGFVEIDRRPRYYRDGTDAVVLQLALGRAS